MQTEVLLLAKSLINATQSVKEVLNAPALNNFGNNNVVAYCAPSTSFPGT